MKFKSRNQEHLVRASAAFLLTMVLAIRIGDRSLLEFIIPSETLAAVAGLMLLVVIGWLAFGKLRTPGRQQVK